MKNSETDTDFDQLEEHHARIEAVQTLLTVVLAELACTNPGVRITLEDIMFQNQNYHPNPTSDPDQERHLASVHAHCQDILEHVARMIDPPLTATNAENRH